MGGEGDSGVGLDRSCLSDNITLSHYVSQERVGIGGGGGGGGW